MLIDVDTRKPLTFTRKIASPGGEEVSIQIHYDKLFKHCSSCGMLTHEVAYCPMKFPVGKDRVERTGVFERVQLPNVATSREPLLRDQKPYDRYETYSRSDRYGKGSRRSISPQRKHRHDGGFMSDARAGYHRSEVYNDSFSRKQGGKENRYSSSFSRRNNRQTASPSPQRSADISMEDRSSRKKIASAIVTPSRQGRDENVTRRNRDTVRLFSFSPKEKAQLDDAQIIGALNDMEIIGTSNMEDVDREDSLMVVDNDDDLLGDELMDLDAEAIKNAPAVGAEGVEATKGKPRASSSRKIGSRAGIPLGLRKKKAEFLRRGSPKLRRSSSRDVLRSETRYLSNKKRRYWVKRLGSEFSPPVNTDSWHSGFRDFKAGMYNATTDPSLVSAKVKPPVDASYDHKLFVLMKKRLQNPSRLI
ncbi:hypothetical protein F2Q68_00016186 [Brassica cretica]|uniref:Zinc knuckle CX2CX4HX4C domain-containing protein n=1 Tax=Brassica cretica TaxID=69181 RepID=A0A8S9HJD5_BRACR|nr:hypothetical protein F2Q68_00016186 [Brassica cretica]